MNYQLNIRLSGGEGSLIRALGLIERRGYRLLSCSVAVADEDGQDMQVNVSSSRSADLLKRQLERLHDVWKVELKSNTDSPQAKSGLRPIKSSLSG